jgi:hypothetical protein
VSSQVESDIQKQNGNGVNLTASSVPKLQGTSPLLGRLSLELLSLEWDYQLIQGLTAKSDGRERQGIALNVTQQKV